MLWRQTRHRESSSIAQGPPGQGPSNPQPRPPACCSCSPWNLAPPGVGHKKDTEATLSPLKLQLGIAGIICYFVLICEHLHSLQSPWGGDTTTAISCARTLRSWEATPRAWAIRTAFISCVTQLQVLAHYLYYFLLKEKSLASSTKLGLYQGQ